MNKLYAAPMEGLTGYLWRQVHAALFGPATTWCGRWAACTGS